jgi:hypothetical protein
MPFKFGQHFDQSLCRASKVASETNALWIGLLQMTEESLLVFEHRLHWLS